jgi:hypothetical protein
MRSALISRLPSGIRAVQAGFKVVKTLRDPLLNKGSARFVARRDWLPVHCHLA